MLKILVYCPTYKRTDGTLAIYPDTQASLDRLKRGRHNVTVEVSASPYEDKQGNVIQQYRRAASMTIDGNYDAALFIEHDMIVPPDALIRMAQADADVVYGLYLFRHGNPVLNAFGVVGGVALGNSLQNHPAELKRARAAGIWPVSGLGFGCTFIHRRVFERVSLHMPADGHYPDGPFAKDCMRAGFRQVAHFGVICGHICPDGRVLWPQLDVRSVDMGMVKVKILRSFNGNVGGMSVPFVSGNVASLPESDAREFERAGLVLVESKLPAVKIANRSERKLVAAVK